MREPRLTKRNIDKLTTSRPEGERFYDGPSGLAGFGVQVQPNGRKSFFLDFTSPVTRKRRRMKIGAFGILTVEQARKEAQQILGQVHAGVDPLAEREQVRQAGTFSEWMEKYLVHGEASGRWRKRTLHETRYYLRLASEAFGSKRLGDITASDIEHFRDVLHTDHGLATANKGLSSVKAALAEAWKRGLVSANEASKVSKISGQLPRTRTLSEDEMGRLMEGVEQHHDPTFRVALLWLALTGARRSEVLRAKWVDLRLDPLERAEWTIPAPKNKRPMVRPIPVELAREIKSLPKTSPLVIGEWTPSRFNHTWERFRASAGLGPDVHLHDLRRTAGLWIARAAGLQAAQRLLGHADISTTAKVYSPLTTEDLRGPQAEVVGKVLSFKKKTEETK